MNSHDDNFTKRYPHFDPRDCIDCPVVKCLNCFNDTAEPYRQVVGYASNQEATTYGTMTFAEWNELCNRSNVIKGKPFDDKPRKLPAQPMVTMPRWLLMIAMFGCLFCGFILGAIVL